METLLKLNSINEFFFNGDLPSNFPQYCVLGFSLFLLLNYFLYSKILWSFLEKTKIPKVYKITTLHSLWMGLIHLMTSLLCFLQLCTLDSHSAQSLQPYFIPKIFHAATANFCQQSTEHSNSSSKSEDFFRDMPEWSSINSIFIIIICAVFIQEILLATRNKMDHIFYSRLLGLVFVVSAVKTSCPSLSIQGTYLISVNSSSKEITRSLVAWKSYSQEDSDHRPSPIMKAITFVVFLYHIVIWCALMLYYLPFFVHKLPSINENDPNRLFLAYSYLSFLAYIVLEAGTSPLWTTIRCLGWCRRSSGLTWRIFALADCHLLGHYGPLVSELYDIQLNLDKRKSVVRKTMLEKHLASIEGRKRKPISDSRARRPASLLATVRTVVALKKKMQRRADDLTTRAFAVEGLPQILVTAEDSKVETDLSDNEVEVSLIGTSESAETPTEIKGKPVAEKDEDPSVEKVMGASFPEEGEEPLIGAQADCADVIQD